MWFEKLTGFREENPAQVRSNLEIKDNRLISKVNGAEFVYGKLELLSLQELKNRVLPLKKYNSKIRVSEVVGNTQTFHKEPANAGAFFQAASQFNLLEMVSPHVIPEKGVGIYENDYTQGPACAIACGAGTIYRNYFVPVNGQIGQSAAKQIDCLADIGTELGNNSSNLWIMANGYALVNNTESLEHITTQIKNKAAQEYEVLKGKLKIGIQWDTEVTISENRQLVSQAYCSALPVAYSHIKAGYWEAFARLILEASYEATLAAGLLNFEKTGNSSVFLTLVGGGAFGNEPAWIFDAIKKAVNVFANSPLNVSIVSYGSSNAGVVKLVESISRAID
ncbi:hypothetical protein C7N43_13415 [Sphingobacteriales bacterium UPWRP_1]|nr:hypothetical protein B6N25_03550 [Sphingobacteriales bacterium TSM_CSS]PSJ76524.1 hypothetical protein C7N43_13415 [Sphingobacteriales bacterium UPWRP_1]